MSYINSQLADMLTAFREPNVFSSSNLLQEIALEAVAQGASDLYFQTGEPVLIKVHGRFKRLTQRRMTTAECLQIVNWASGTEQASGLIAEGKESKTSYNVIDPVLKDGRGEKVRHRFRSNAIGGEFRGSTGVQIVMRSIRSIPPTVQELGIEKEIVEASTPESGIVLITGATGMGKSTTFAALTRNILEGDTPIKGNILTIESPIEYLFNEIESEHSVVFQTDVGKGGGSFAQCVISAMRQDPSMIVIGETRDEATASAALEGANTGHLVYSTLHTNNCASIPARLLSFYEPSVRESIVFPIIDSARLFMNQRLVESVDGKRVGLREYLVLTEEIREEIIATADAARITAAVRQHLRKSGRPMSLAAEMAYESGLISEAVMNENRKN